LDERLAEIRQVMFETRTYAVRVTSLMQTVVRTVRHLNQLLSKVEAFVGNQQANQTMTQVQTTIGENVAILVVQSAAAQRADGTDRLTEALILESLRLIMLDRLADHPR
jgi:hypothetical protein